MFLSSNLWWRRLGTRLFVKLHVSVNYLKSFALSKPFVATRQLSPVNKNKKKSKNQLYRNIQKSLWRHLTTMANVVACLISICSRYGRLYFESGKLWATLELGPCARFYLQPRHQEIQRAVKMQRQVNDPKCNAFNTQKTSIIECHVAKIYIFRIF